MAWLSIVIALLLIGSIPVFVYLAPAVRSRSVPEVRTDDLSSSMAQTLGDALPRLRIEFAIDHRAAGNGRALTGHRPVVIGCALVA